MHGDETGGFILMLRLAEYLLMNGRTDHGSVILFKTLRLDQSPYKP